MFGRGVNMREAEIYIKNIKTRKKLDWTGGCRLSIGGGGVFTPRGVKILMPPLCQSLELDQPRPGGPVV